LGSINLSKVIFFAFKGTDKGWTQNIEELLNVEGVTTQTQVTLNKYFLISSGNLAKLAYNDYKNLPNFIRTISFGLLDIL